MAILAFRFRVLETTYVTNSRGPLLTLAKRLGDDV